MNDNLDVSRRELLGALARWTVPTVVTFTLGARVLEAKASCPPCQRKQGQQCKACTVSQMLNCNCEPCLGPPYCAPVGALNAGPNANVQAPGSRALPGQPGYNPNSGAGERMQTYYQIQRERARLQNDPFSQPLYRDPYGVQRTPYGQQKQQPGLYDRLYPDSTSRRRN